MRLYPITIDIGKLTTEMVEWAELQGAVVEDDPIRKRTMITFPNSKTSAWAGGQSMRLHFDFSQKNSALLFVLLFQENVLTHNMKELDKIKDLYVTA